MALTKKQEDFLSDFADKGLAEIKEAEDREVEIVKIAEKEAAKEVALTELKTKYEADVEAALVAIEEEFKK